MFKMNKDMEYALISIQEIEGHRTPVPAREIARKYKLPYEILSKILQKLGNRKILHSTQGTKGGYTLVENLEKVSLLDLFTALQGEIHIVSCVKEGTGCLRTDFCSMKHSMMNMQTLLTSFFGSISVKEFLNMGKMSPEEVTREYQFTGALPGPLSPGGCLKKEV